jgi:hypothetical protein
VTEDDAPSTPAGAHERETDGDHATHESEGDTTGRPVRHGTVHLRTRAGETVRHDEAVVRYDPDAFVVSTDPSFPPDATERYEKSHVSWIEVRHPRR